MTARVLVRQGGAVGAGTTDFNVFTPPKGAPAFDHPGTTLLSGGMRWADGEAAAATFKILDPNGELPRSDGQFNLPAHALVTFTEDASGCAHWWHRGRMSGPTNSGRGEAKGANAVEFDATSDDGNVELKGQAFVEPWPRPQETGYQRLVALQAYTLNGTASTATYHRDTCQVVVLDSHLCKNANSQILPATTYPIGTQPLDVVADCATTEGKDYGVVIHDGGFPGGSLASIYSHGAKTSWSDPFNFTVPSGLTDSALVVFTVTNGTTTEMFYNNDPVNHPGSGTAMTEIGSTTAYGVEISAWILVNPDPSTTPLGYSQVFGTGSGGSGPGGVSYYLLSNVDQSTPVADTGSGSTATNGGATVSASIAGTGLLVLNAVGFTQLWTVPCSGTPDSPNSLDDNSLIPASFGITSNSLQQAHAVDVTSVSWSGMPDSSCGAAGWPFEGSGLFAVAINGLGTAEGCDHLCLQYIVPTDLTTNPCSLKISDQRSEVDEDTATPPTTYAPRWLNGKGTTGDTQDQVSGLIYQYQTTTGSGSIFTQNTADITSYDYWVEAVSDSLVETPAQAALRAPAILGTRRTAHVTHTVSIPLAADQLHHVQAGMAIQIKSVVTGGGQALGTYLTRRIVQVVKEPRNDGTYWVHMQLNRPQRMVPNGNIGGAVGQPTKATIVDGTFAGDSVQQALEALAAGTTGPLTTLGDMLYRGPGGSNTRLPIGPSNTHLRSDGSKPVWSPESPTLTNPMTTAWDLIRGGVGGTPTRFALGASNTVLSSDGTQFLWDTKPSGGGTGLTDPMTTIGDIIVRNASNVTARLGIGASNTVLTSLGSGIAPVWQTPTGGGGGGGGDAFPLDIPPGSASTWDDEFAGSSLDAKWTNPGSSGTGLGLTVTEGNGWMYFEPSTSGSSSTGKRAFFIRQNSPTGDFTVSARVFDGLPGVDDGRCGVFVARTASTEAHICGPDGGSGTNKMVMYIATAGYSETADWGSYDGTYTPLGVFQGPALWCRIRWVSASSTLFFDYSANGVVWVNLTSRTGRSQPDRIGLVNYANVANMRADHIIGADWFRVTEP